MRSEQVIARIALGLAGKIEVTTKTIQRDIDFIAGSPESAHRVQRRAKRLRVHPASRELPYGGAV